MGKQLSFVNIVNFQAENNFTLIMYLCVWGGVYCFTIIILQLKEETQPTSVKYLSQAELSQCIMEAIQDAIRDTGESI